MNPSCLYAALGVPRDATPGDITRAFRSKAKRAHPDAGGSAEEFDKINTAKAVLLDPARRARYDATGETGSEAAQNPDHAAITILTSLFAAIVERADDPAALDMIAGIRTTLEGEIANVTSKRKSLERKKAKLEKLAGRFKRKGKGANLFEGALKAQIAPVVAQMENASRAIADAKRALELLAEFEFEREAVPQAMVRFVNAATTATTFG